jgi:protein gp37
MLDSLIAWTHNTWNPWRGCSGENCFLRAIRACYIDFPLMRLREDPNQPNRASVDIQKLPLVWQMEAAKAGHAKRVFCGSLMDFNDVNADPIWRKKAWSIIKDTPNLCYMLLSKCPERYEQNLPDDWHDGYPNVWIGASVLHAEDYRRNTKHLTKIPAARRFLSIEPLIGEIPQPDFTGIDLILVGGMSGSEWMKHMMKMEWAASLFQATRTWNDEHDKPVSYFFKQNSAPLTERGIDALGNYLNLPDPIIREMPSAPGGLTWAPMEEKGERG